MNLINLEQGSPEWLTFRKSKIGGSDAPIILGLSKYCKPLKLWGQKVGLVPEQPTNEWMERGKRLEEDARQIFCGIIGIQFAPQVAVSNTYNWMSASFDGISEDAILEIKCNGSKNHMIALDGKVPDPHYCQMQHQLAVSGFDYGYYYSFDGTDGVSIKVTRDNEYIKRLIDKELSFWHCMCTFTPPE